MFASPLFPPPLFAPPLFPRAAGLTPVPTPARPGTALLVVYRGQDWSLTCPAPAGFTGVAGWSALCTVYDPKTLAVCLTKATGAGIVTSSTGLAVTFTAADTLALPLGQLAIDIWRADATANVPLFLGSLAVRASVRYAA